MSGDWVLSSASCSAVLYFQVSSDGSTFGNASASQSQSARTFHCIMRTGTAFESASFRFSSTSERASSFGALICSSVCLLQTTDLPKQPVNEKDEFEVTESRLLAIKHRNKTHKPTP